MVRQWIANPLSPVRIWVPPLRNFKSFLKVLHLMNTFVNIVLLRWGRGGIGRHDGLKIRCLVIVREGSSPSVPIIVKKEKISINI